MHASKLIRSTHELKHADYTAGDLRHAFREAIGEYEAWENGEPEPCVELGGRKIRISIVCGLIWNCTDLFPSQYQTQLRDYLPYVEQHRNLSTYARAARALRELVADAR
jgi:hypothetical protein